MFNISNIVSILLMLGVVLGSQFSLATEINPIRQYNLEQYIDALVAENKIQIKKEYSKHEIIALIYNTSKKYNLNYKQMFDVSKCESNFNQNAKGDSGNSWGIYQINLPAHPEITKEQALNPEWAINWTAKEWQKGNQWKWTCFKLLTKKI